MSSDERLRALERSGDRQAYLRECWRVGGRDRFEAALEPGDEVEVDSFFADRKPALVEPGTPVRLLRLESMTLPAWWAGDTARSSVRNEEWLVEADAGSIPAGKYCVSWLRPRGLVPRGHGG